MSLDNAVAVGRCARYETAAVRGVLEAQFAALGIEGAFFAGKRVVVKPNLVTPSHPSKCVVTHPAVIEAAAGMLRDWGARVLIAESPGGPYMEPLLANVYRVTGAAEAASRAGVDLNTDLSFSEFHAPNGAASKMFPVITPILEADCIVNLCKLKTHTLAMMSAAVKNLFGVVPGIQKFELHARFASQREFMASLVDLCEALCAAKPIIHICDAVDGMEGNGPSGGSPRHIGCLLTSRNPYALDQVCAELIGLSGSVPMLAYAEKRGLCPERIDTIGEALSEFVIRDYQTPDTKRGKKFDWIPSFLEPRPTIDTESCIGCGKCAESCPVQTISMLTEKKAYIHRKSCIRCFCCQELCPCKAVNIHKNFIFKLIT